MASPVESVRAVARRMGEYNVGTVVVVDEARKPIGILTDRDIAMRCVAPGESADVLSVSNIMTTPVRTVAESAPIEDAVSTMKRLGVRRLPVTDATGTLAGLIALDDVLALIAEESASIGTLLRKEEPVLR
jgi:signal-transduction protein with cAMP-binding, CBS, and nucleotidyltransferase domain